MLMRAGEHWHCMNPQCRAVIYVEWGAASEGENPRCSCGSVLKKEYRIPVLSYLDFLHLEFSAIAGRKSREE